MLCFQETSTTIQPLVQNNIQNLYPLHQRLPSTFHFEDSLLWQHINLTGQLLCLARFCRRTKESLAGGRLGKKKCEILVIRQFIPERGCYTDLMLLSMPMSPASEEIINALINADMNKMMYPKSKTI